MPPPLLQLQDISLSFGVMPLLSGATLAVAAGDRICLVGRNGSGKSTLLRIAAGLVQADTGERFAQPGATIQYLPQEPDLAGFGTTLAYVEAGFRLERGRPRLSSQWTRRWREMDSNFRFRASGDTPHRPRGEAASHRSRLPLRRDPPSGRDLDDGTVSQQTLRWREIPPNRTPPGSMWVNSRLLTSCNY